MGHLAKTAQEIESGLEAKVTSLETEVQEKAKAVAELRSEVEESKQKYTAEKACSDEKSKKLADLNVKDVKTTLHWAARMNRLNVVKELLRRGANIEVQDEYGET